MLKNLVSRYILRSTSNIIWNHHRTGPMIRLKKPSPIPMGISAKISLQRYHFRTYNISPSVP